LGGEGVENRREAQTVETHILAVAALSLLSSEAGRATMNLRSSLLAIVLGAAFHDLRAARSSTGELGKAVEEQQRRRGQRGSSFVELWTPIQRRIDSLLSC